MRSFPTSLKFVVLASIFSAAAYAGGPLYTLNGKAVRYRSNIITYKTDRGPFGIFTNAQARALADSSFKTWENVPTSNVCFQHTDADTLAVDVNGSNYLQYTTLTDFKYDGISPIIFDSDGSITEAMFGEGSSSSVIGFAGSGDADNDGYFDEGESVMNGVFANGKQGSFTLAEWKSTFVHEFGHFLGLDHTQINGEFESDSSKTIYIPTMYPFSTANDVPLGDLNPDDMAAISVLYPETGYAATVGSIAGNATRANGTSVRGANVIAISTGADSLMNRISTVTDYFEEGTGTYTISGLAPGSYVVRIEPIDPAFIEGSGVGPYTADESGLSFINPVTAEYYNGANESADSLIDDPNARTPVTVTAGAATGGINFICKSAPAPGKELLTEGFTGSAGTPLTTAGWTISGTSNLNPLSIVQPGLTFPGYKSEGNAVLVNTTGQDVYKSFTPVEDGTVYLSFLINVDTAKTGDYFIALSPSTSQTNYYARLHLKSSGSGFLLGISKLNEKSGGNKYGTTVLKLHTTYLVVVKYEFIAQGTADDRISVYAFGSSSTVAETAPPEIDAYTNTLSDATDLGFVTLRQGSAAAAPYLTLDGIRVGTTWPDILTGVEAHAADVPSAIGLEQNYPNPFNPSTTIRFVLPSESHVRLRVFDLAGREACVAVEGTFSAGAHDVSFNGARMASGTYFYVLEAGTHREIRRMMLVK